MYELIFELKKNSCHICIIFFWFIFFQQESGSKLKEFEIQLQEVEKEEAKCTSKLKATKDSVKSQMKSKLQLEKSLEDVSHCIIIVKCMTILTFNVISFCKSLELVTNTIFW